MNELEKFQYEIVKNIHHHRKFYGDVLMLTIDASFKSEIFFNQIIEVCYKIFVDFSKNVEDALEISAQYKNINQQNKKCYTNVLTDFTNHAQLDLEEDNIFNISNIVIHDLIFEKHFIYFGETAYKSFAEYINFIESIDLLTYKINCINYMNDYAYIDIL